MASVEAAARGLREDFLAGKRELMRSMCMRLRFENGDYVWLNTCAVMDPDVSDRCGNRVTAAQDAA